MEQKHENFNFHSFVAVSTAIIAVLAAIASFQASSNSSQMLNEKNNSILFQNKANKEWNNYLAVDIRRQIQNIPSISREQEDFKNKANALEDQAAQASDKFQRHFEKNSHFVTAGTFLEIAIALSAMSTLIKRRAFWIFALAIAGIGIYFLVVALV